MEIIYKVIFLALPLLLCGGFFIRNKAPSCLYCFGLFFLVSGFFMYDYFSATYTELPAYGFGLEGTALSPAFFYCTKLLSVLVPDYRAATLIWSAVISGGLTLYIYKYCYYPVPSAITAAVTGIWLVNFINPPLFAGMLIAAFAFRYASERRFVRFLAVILLAASFDLRLLIVIPLYIFFITKPTLYHIIGAALSAAALLFFDLSPVFGFFPGFSEERIGSELFFPVTVSAVCVAAALCAKIIMRRGSYNCSMITVLAASAVLGLGAVSDARLMLPAFVCFFPAALTLMPEIIAVAKSIVTLTFREKKKPFLIAGAAILLLGAAAYYGAVLNSAEYMFDISTWMGVNRQ